MGIERNPGWRRTAKLHQVQQMKRERKEVDEWEKTSGLSCGKQSTGPSAQKHPTREGELAKVKQASRLGSTNMRMADKTAINLPNY